MIAVIAGATGLVGSFVVQKLIENPQFSKVISISRKPTGHKNVKLQEILITDLLELSRYSEALNGEIYFCCLGTTIKDAGSKEKFEKIDFQAIIDFGRIAQAHHAKSFVLISAMGADTRSMIFYNQVKGRTEQELKSLRLKRLVIFQPGLLMGDRKAFRLGEKVMISAFNKLSPLIPENILRIIATDSERLADRMIAESLDPSQGVFTIPSRDI